MEIVPILPTFEEAIAYVTTPRAKRAKKRAKANALGKCKELEPAYDELAAALAPRVFQCNTSRTRALIDDANKENASRILKAIHAAIAEASKDNAPRIIETVRALIAEAGKDNAPRIIETVRALIAEANAGQRGAA